MEVAAPTPDETVVERLDRATAAVSAASAELLRSAAEGDDQRVWRRDGATSMTSWLAARYGIAWGTAREWVRVAHALRRLPRIAEAYASGRLSWDQLRPLTRFATAETDVEWAHRAPVLRPWTLYREARRHERIRRDEARDLHRRRYLSMWWDRDLPVLYLEGMLPAEQGAAVEAALRRRTEDVVLEEPPESPPHQARLADALVELVAGSAGDGPAATALVVHTDAETVRRDEPETGPWLAETEGGQRLAGETVRRLACDARIEWVLESEGQPVGIGRRGRQVPEAIHRIFDIGTARCVGSPAASGNGGSTPIIWSTGRTAGPRTSTTWSSCATPTTG
jgi:hypothetical protein